MNRRKFVYKTSITAGSLFLSGFLRGNINGPESDLLRYKNKPSVIIRDIGILRIGKDYLIEVRSDQGETGRIPANSKIRYLIDMLTELIIPFFIKKDARRIEELVNEIYRVNSNYKYAGMPFWICVAHVELAVLDMLGRIESLPVGALFGNPLRDSFAVYLSTFDRENTAEVYLKSVTDRIGSFRAVKLKIGGRMSNDIDCLPGRTEKMIPLFRKELGDEITLYVDANSSYSAGKAIEVGRLLEENHYGFFEEPCPWQDYRSTRQVSDALELPVAGGEQDSSYPGFKYMIEENVLDILQPDIMYNGGFIRTLRIAKACTGTGIPVTLHSPQTGAANAFKMQFASIVDQIGDFQEYNEGQGYLWCRIPLDITDGYMKIVNRPGWGIEYDHDVLKKAKKVK